MTNGFWEMVRFELRLRLRTLTTYIFWVVLFGLAVAIMSVDTALTSNSEGGAYLNAPSSLALIGIILVALFSTMVSSIAGTAIYRDFESNSHALFFSSRLTKADYWFGRFTGSFLVTLLVFSALPLGFLAGTFMPWVHKELLGPFRADAYLALSLHYLLPDLFLVAALFFVGGALTRSLLAIYTQGIVLLVLWIASAAITSGLRNREVAAIFEPFGLSALAAALRYWTVYEQNTMILPLTGVLLQNRLLWTGMGIVVLVGGYFVFDFAQSPRVLLRRQVRVQESAPVPVFAGQASAVIAAGWQYHVATFLRLLRFYTGEILRGVPFIVVTISGVLLLIIVASEADKAYDTPVYPVTRVMLETIKDTFPFFLLALIFFYAGELVWRERVQRTDQITDSLPVSSATTLAAKVGAVLVMLGVLDLVLIVVGILVQLCKGFTHIELSLYFAWLFGLSFWAYAAMVFLAFFLHTVINQKFLTYAAVVVFFIVSGTLNDWGFSRHIFFYGERPDFTYSDMNGFGPFLAPLRWHNIYWFAAGILLLIVALKLWVRGTDYRWKTRWQGSQLGIGSKTVAVLAGLTYLGTGAFIIYNTDILNRYTTEKTDNNLAAHYEKAYKKRYERMPQPRITGIALDITLYPERQQYVLRGTYQLRNKTKEPIREIVLDYDRDLTIKKLAWSVPTRPNVVDKESGFRTFLLDKPLAPGGTMGLDFEFADEHRGFKNDGAETSIAANGTFLTMPAPHIGYQEASELTDTKERRDHKLLARRAMPPVTDMAAREQTYLGNDADWITFDATVRTAPDQTAVAPGYLVKEWNEKGRRCFQYHMDAPIRDFYSILSARYKIKNDQWISPDGKKVALAVFYHPAHPWNIERMLTGVKASLTYCSENFGPYQFRQLRVLEFPNYAPFAQSFPNTVPYSEGVGFIARVNNSDENLDYPLYISAHETAHQWWAHQVLGGDVEGSEMLSESLAEYSALMVIKKKFGKDYLRRFLRYDLDQYLAGRGKDSGGENPLVKAQHQQYIHYSKGSLVFCALAERIGEERLNAILARFLKDKKFQEPPYTTAAELVEYLKQGASEDEKAYIRDLFEHITIYECKAVSAKRKKQKSGKWQVVLTYSVRKYYADKKGRQTPAAFSGEVLDIATFDKSGKRSPNTDNMLGKALQVTHITLKDSASTKKPGVAQATFTFHDIARVPYYAGIDPYNVMIDRNRDDNVETIGNE